MIVTLYQNSFDKITIHNQSYNHSSYRHYLYYSWFAYIHALLRLLPTEHLTIAITNVISRFLASFDPKDLHICPKQNGQHQNLKSLCRDL